MEIRLGYACISETLPDITSSSTYTYTNFLKEEDFNKLDRVITSNLLDLEQIIKYNIKNNIHFYRLSSKIIPLATKKEVSFDYTNKYMKNYNKIGNYINKSNMRVDFHPDQFCILNSVNKEVVDNTIETLKYHYNILKSLGIENKILLLHIGSNVFGKKNSLQRFINNFRKLPDYLQKCIAIENDDKVFNIDDCIYLSKNLDIPIVVDYHHYLCNRGELDLFENFDIIFSTWKGMRPKIHFSSPKNKTKKEFRSHNDYIDPNSFIDFLKKLKENSKIKKLDIMIEAKKKDEALFRLVRYLKYKTNYNFIDETCFYI